MTLHQTSGSAPKNSWELEIKLTAQTDEQLAAILNDPQIITTRISQIPIDKLRMVATYLDTPTSELWQQHQVAFRIRQEGNRWRAGIKERVQVVAGVGMRQELEQDVSGPLKKVAQLPQGELKNRLATLIDPQQTLQPLMITDVVRQIVQLQLASATKIELVLDQGVLQAGGRIKKICEAELELVSGEADHLRSFAQQLVARHNLNWVDDSKFAVGLELLKN